MRRTTRCEPMGKGWGGGGVAEATCGYTLTTFFHRQETKTKSKMSTTACGHLSCPHHHTDILFTCWGFRLLAVGRASRLRLRAGDAPNSSGTRGDFLHQDVPRDGNSGKDVVFPMPHLHRSSFLSLGTSYDHLASRRARRRRRGRDVKLPTTSRATRRETEPDSKMHTQQLDASSRVLAASLGASLSFTSRPGERRGRCVRTEREVISGYSDAPRDGSCGEDGV